MIIDFSFILVAALFVTGIIWGLDAWLWKPKRSVAADGQSAPEPVVVEYARSFFPVILIVVVIRSFLLEPFRIPSDSMMPTLLDGDFIFVNKLTYGLRLPVANTKIMSLGDPERGDVVVFRLPSDPATNYIKRLVGLPGDHVVVRDNRIFVNGLAMPIQADGFYIGQGYSGAQVGKEKLGDIEHSVMITQDRYATDYEATVPSGHYFFMGDNRNNSLDSRFPQVGFVPDKNLVGRAERIWMHWRWREMPKWGRIGQAIH
jgi:signal peptidase I